MVDWGLLLGQEEQGLVWGLLLECQGDGGEGEDGGAGLHGLGGGEAVGGRLALTLQGLHDQAEVVPGQVVVGLEPDGSPECQLPQPATLPS